MELLTTMPLNPLISIGLWEFFFFLAVAVAGLAIFILQAFPGFKSDINDMIQSAEFRRGFELLDLDGGIERDLYINGMIQSATKKVQKQHWLILISVGKVC